MEPGLRLKESKPKPGKVARPPVNTKAQKAEAGGLPQVRVQPGYTLSSRLATFQGDNLSRDCFVPLCGGGVAGTRTRKMLFVHFTIKCLLFTVLAVDKRSRARLVLVGLAS